MKTFYAVLANSLTANVVNFFVWFAVTFWLYLETQSVIATSIMAGIFTATVAVSGFFLGSLVDRFRKKTSMLLSSATSLGLYLVAGAIYFLTPQETLTNVTNPLLWVFIALILMAAIAGNMRAIALSTVVTILIPEDTRDRANGMVGTANGVSFLLSSILSGAAVGFLGMPWVMGLGIGLTLLVILHLLTISIPEREVVHVEQESPPEASGMVDIRGTIKAISLVPGLFGLIFFNSLNNLLGGVFMSLMDAYGLQLVSPQVWGLLWGMLSTGFIVGGILVARFGLGKVPVRTLFMANIVMWTICCVFTFQASIVLLCVGMFIWMTLMPAVEASEQTILQKVITPERQGRVFGFAQSIEQAASPVSAFIIGPIAQFIFIPYMTTGSGVEQFGGWFGTGTIGGLGLVFTVTGLIGLIITLIAMRTPAYRTLINSYVRPSFQPAMAE